MSNGAKAPLQDFPGPAGMCPYLKQCARDKGVKRHRFSLWGKVFDGLEVLQRSYNTGKGTTVRVSDTTVVARGDDMIKISNANRLKNDHGGIFDMEHIPGAPDVFCATGPEHDLRRPFFEKIDTQRLFSSACKEMVGEIDKRITGLFKHGAVSAQIEIEQIYFDVLSRFIYGSFKPEGFLCKDEFREFAGYIHDAQFASGIQAKSEMDRFKKLQAKYFDNARSAINQAKEGKLPVDCVASFVVKQRQKDINTKLTDDDLASMCTIIYIGGLFSGTAAIVNTLYGLFHCSRAHLKTLRKCLPGREGKFDLKDFDSQELTIAVSEGLRWRTSVPLVPREVVQEVELPDGKLPVGTSAIFCNRLDHSDEKYWGTNARDEYDTSRWTQEKVANNTLSEGSSHFWPFGIGPRSCPGRDMHILVHKLIVARAVILADMKFSGDHTCSFFFACCTVPDILVQVLPRDDSRDPARFNQHLRWGNLLSSCFQGCLGKRLHARSISKV